jgi:hypothetical protein
VTQPAPPALAATVVAIVAEGQQKEAVDALHALRAASGIQPIVVSLGTVGEAPREDRDGVIVLTGLLPRYLNNAVASLRLSSLPAMGWWRTQESDTLRDLAVLVDRLVLDVPDPLTQWRSVAAVAQVTSVTDLRWARLTRWRDLLAQFFALPDVRRPATPFDRLEIDGADQADSALFAGWLKARMPGGATLRIDRRAAGRAPLERVQLSGDAGRVTLALLPNTTCLEATHDTPTGSSSTRIVPAGDARLDVLLRGELRIRSRDLAFEDAAREASTL